MATPEIEIALTVWSNLVVASTAFVALQVGLVRVPRRVHG